MAEREISKGVFRPRAEKLVEAKRFSPEAREALKKEGFLIYGLTGQSIKSLRESGRKFWSTWHEDYPQFETLTSRRTEVAINPQKVFLPNSNRKTLREQEETVADFSRQLSKKIKGAKAILGEAPDYIELAFTHLDATGDYLFGEKYNYDYARTKTETTGSGVAHVGLFLAGGGLVVYDWSRDRADGGVWAVPLVVPR